MLLVSHFQGNDARVAVSKILAVLQLNLCLRSFRVYYTGVDGESQSGVEVY